MLTNKEKIIEVTNRLNSLKIHIPILEENIKDYPDGDHPDKPTRESVLQDIKAKVGVLQEELDKLTT
jgi:hypothetical protein